MIPCGLKRVGIFSVGHVMQVAKEEDRAFCGLIVVNRVVGLH
jgi:hypothetical protein